MELTEMRKMADEIMALKRKYAYRNVIGYFVGSDADGAVFVSKENSSAPKKGIFLNIWETNKMYDIQTGNEVLIEDVFGKTFFADDPSLFTDVLAQEELTLAEKIDVLHDASEELAFQLLETPVAFVMANGFFEDEEENLKSTYTRFLVLFNFLKKCTQKISTEEFAFMHHELMTI